MKQKHWNRMTAAAVLAMAAGGLWNGAGGGPAARLLTLLGAALFAAALVGSHRDSARHPCRCPVCGEALRPVGRWLPGGGYNGTDTVVCPRCGAASRIRDLKQDD